MMVLCRHVGTGHDQMQGGDKGGRERRSPSLLTVESTAFIPAALRLHINHTNTLMQSKVQAGMRAMRENDFLPQQGEEEEEAGGVM